MPSTKRCIDRQTCLSGWVLCIVNVDRNMNINLSGWYIYSHGLRHWATARFVFPRLMQWKRRLGPRVVVCHVKYLYSVISQWKINLAKERENQFGKCTIEWQALPSVEGGRGRSFSAPAFFRFGFIQYSAGKCQNIRQSNVRRTHNFASLIHSRIFLLRFFGTFPFGLSSLHFTPSPCVVLSGNKSISRLQRCLCCESHKIRKKGIKHTLPTLRWNNIQIQFRSCRMASAMVKPAKMLFRITRETWVCTLFGLTVERMALSLYRNHPQWKWKFSHKLTILKSHRLIALDGDFPKIDFLREARSIKPDWVRRFSRCQVQDKIFHRKLP